MMRNWKSPSQIILLVSIATYFLSLALPGILYEPREPDKTLLSYTAASAYMLNGGNCILYTDVPVKLLAKDVIVLAYPKPGISITKDSQFWCWDSNVKGPPIVEKGISVLLHGIQGIWIFNFAWFANLFGVIAIILALKQKWPLASTVFAGIGFIVGLQSLDFHGYPGDEGGVKYVHAVGLGAGFYVWELSFLLLALSQFISGIQDYSKKKLL